MKKRVTNAEKTRQQLRKSRNKNFLAPLGNCLCSCTKTLWNALNESIPLSKKKIKKQLDPSKLKIKQKIELMC